jgi:hypothetical protein
MRIWENHSAHIPENSYGLEEYQAFSPSYDLAPSPSHPSPVKKLSVFPSLIVFRRSSLLTGEGCRGGLGGARSYVSEKAWFSINCSMFSAWLWFLWSCRIIRLLWFLPQGQVDAETIQSYLDLEKEIAAAEQTRYIFHNISIKQLRMPDFQSVLYSTVWYPIPIIWIKKFSLILTFIVPNI